MDPYTYDRRMYRRMYRQQNPLRGLAGGIFILFLLLAFLIGRGGDLFLPLFFIGLAACTLVASLSTFHPRGIYSGLVGAIWLLGLALCFAVGFWPWILLPVAVSMILGSLFRPITGALGPVFLPPNQPMQQPYQPPYEPSQQAPIGTYQEGGSLHPYPPEQPPADPDQAPPTTPLS